MARSRLIDSFLHLRLPFSFFLMPIWLFAVWSSTSPQTGLVWLTFFIIHFLLYPASHAFNTWYDRDEQSVGGLKVPPPVHTSLFWMAWGLDAAVVVSSWFVSSGFLAAMVLYTLGSKLYSWKVTRLKRRPWTGWLGVGVIQGALTFVAVVQTIGTPYAWDSPVLWLGALTAALFLMGVYPLTQVYQHEEDAAHGDLTVSRRVGIRGTFVLAALFLLLAVAAFVVVFYQRAGWELVGWFFVVQAPTVLYFLHWAWAAFRDPAQANFRRTMHMNVLASGLMCVFFVWKILP